jgi:hypothetical protein
LSINSVVVKLGRILLAGPLEATQNGTWVGSVTHDSFNRF